MRLQRIRERTKDFLLMVGGLIGVVAILIMVFYPSTQFTGGLVGFLLVLFGVVASEGYLKFTFDPNDPKFKFKCKEISMREIYERRRNS